MQLPCGSKNGNWLQVFLFGGTAVWTKHGNEPLEISDIS